MSEHRHVTPEDEVEVERTTPDSAHWLVRPRTIRRLWLAGIAVLGATVLAELVFPLRGSFGFDDWLGFAAVFGFFSCVVMVFFAKALGLLLKRPEDHYDR